MGRLKHIFSTLFIIACTIPLTVQAAEPIKIVSYQIEGQSDHGFEVLSAIENPFSPLHQLENYTLTILPVARAYLHFCNGDFDVLYPSVTETQCPANLVQAFTVETNMYVSKPDHKAKILGLRVGFQYDIARLTDHLPMGSKVFYVESDSQLVKMLKSDRLGAIVLEATTAKSLFSKHNIELGRLIKIPMDSLVVSILIQESQLSLTEKIQNLFSEDN